MHPPPLLLVLLFPRSGVDIADDGTFLFREAVRINFGHLVAQQFNGDIVTVSGCQTRVRGVCVCVQAGGWAIERSACVP